MSDEQVQAPAGNLAMAPLSGFLQGYQFGQNIQAGKQAASDAADAREQQQQNFQSQQDLQKQGMAQNQSNAEADRAQALDIFKQKLAQDQSIHDADDANRRLAAINGTFNTLYSGGLGFQNSLIRAIQSYDAMSPGHPLSHVPMVGIEGSPLPVVLHEGDPAHPVNGPLPPGQSPIGPTPGFTDQAPDAGTSLRAIGPVNPNGGTPMQGSPLQQILAARQAQDPYANVAGRIAGGGAPVQGQPQGQMPTAPMAQQPQAAQPAQGQPANPQQVNDALNVMSALRPGIGPSGSLDPMAAMIPNGPMAGVTPAGPPPLTPVQEVAAMNRTASDALNLPQRLPPLDKDASPDMLQKAQIAQQQYDTAIQAAQDAHTAAAREAALTDAKTILVKAQADDLTNSAKTGNILDKLKQEELQGSIAAQKATTAIKNREQDLNEAKFNWQKKQDVISNQQQNALNTLANGGKYSAEHASMFKNTSDNITQLIKLQAAEQAKFDKTQTDLTKMGQMLKIPQSAWTKDNTDINTPTGLKENPDYTLWKNLHIPVPDPSDPSGKATVLSGQQMYEQLQGQLRTSQQNIADNKDRIKANQEYLNGLKPGLSRDDVLLHKTKGDALLPPPTNATGTATVTPPPSTATPPKTGAGTTKSAPTGTKKVPVTPATKAAPAKTSAPAKPAQPAVKGSTSAFDFSSGG